MTTGGKHKRAWWAVVVIATAALWCAAPAGAFVYWTDGGSGAPGSIGRANPDGTNPQQVFIGDAGAPYGMAVDGQYVYWAEFSDSIWRAPIAGGQPQELIGGLSTPWGLAVDAQNIYWVNKGTNSIGRARLADPGNPDATFITVPSGNTIQPGGIAVDNGYIYWANDASNTFTIARASLADPTHPNLSFVTSIGAASALTVGGGYVYWTNDNTIGRASLANPGSPSASFITGAQGAFAIAVDSLNVYWATGLGQCQGNCTVARASLADPAHPQINFVTGATLTYGIAVDPGAPVPSSTRIPAISGSDQEGQTLTETAGAWANNPTTVTVQWARCDPSGATCADIAGATTPSYTLTAADVGATVRVREVATNIWGPGAAAVSVPTALITSAIPSSISPPVISGSAVHGQTLTSAHGAWSNGPTSFADQWLRCDASGSACRPISGAIGQRYTLTAADVHTRIAVQETAANDFGGGGPATSTATDAVAEPTPPTALTLPASAITQNSATLHARVNPGGGPTTALFKVSRKRSLVGATSTTAQLVPDGSGSAAVSATVAKLSPSTRYYYRVVATNSLSGKSVSGPIISFQTPAPPPRVNATMGWNMQPKGGGVAISSLTIADVPRLARVEIDCRGGGCPFARRTLAASHATPCHQARCRGRNRAGTVELDVTSQFRGRLLATAAIVIVKITSRGWVGKEYVFHMSHPTQPQIGCLAPGGSKLGKGC